MMQMQLIAQHGRFQLRQKEDGAVQFVSGGRVVPTLNSRDAAEEYEATIAARQTASAQRRGMRQLGRMWP